MRATSAAVNRSTRWIWVYADGDGQKEYHIIECEQMIRAVGKYKISPTFFLKTVNLVWFCVGETRKNEMNVYSAMIAFGWCYYGNESLGAMLT
jgi:hypothetical protein